MTIILATNQAVCLDNLLSQVDTSGIDYTIKTNAKGMPTIRGIGSLVDATEQEIGFLANAKFFDLLQVTKAGAVILPKKAIDALPADVPFTIVECEQPYLLYARITQWFEKAKFSHHTAQIHEKASIDSTAKIGKNVTIRALAVIEANAVIEDDVVIEAGAVVGEGCKVGQGTKLYPNVTLYHGVEIGRHCIIHSGAVIGADGFGFAPDSTKEQGAWSKISQLGTVIIEDDVEIGANTTIDRGALANTVIHRGVKLDNQIMIGHNCEVGEHTAMAACVGIAGSTKIGKRCTLAGAAMMAGHIELGDDVHISGATGVMSSITKPGRYTGAWPIQEHRDWQRNAAALTGLYELRRRLQKVEQFIDNMDSKE
ncbi:UDP-3-O-(3-hydroxymyristoyl) glucosamine N-acyltransferase [Pelistega indica]|uniref:UDP-3-O-acylglucosamine N-acyltransferase n=1 Tax=Pelistega indica TaxID=1414851 RepID=V8G998_9BURK|nr:MULTISPECIES: UDP-3-O-(3-hydroxymyristoyl)glucosamine N-acyltransferase [Pelistega]ETD72508.1 UDP-3-O-(3-hydroxymyristoyl) glucosamine N-acyltransferase [Pelistega indica]